MPRAARGLYSPEQWEFLCQRLEKARRERALDPTIRANYEALLASAEEKIQARNRKVAPSKLTIRKALPQAEMEALVRERLREARQMAGLTQKEAAMLVGRGQAYISKMEAGRCSFTLKEILSFATAYAVPWQFLLPLPKDRVKRAKALSQNDKA